MAVGKKGRKVGRNKKSCEQYRAAGTLKKNKIRKLARRVLQFPQDLKAATDLKRWRLA